MKVKFCFIFIYVANILCLFSQENKNFTLPENPTIPQVEIFLDSTALQINRHYYAGDYAEAIVLAKNVLYKTDKKGFFSRQFEIRSFLGNTYLRLDDIDEAQKVFEENSIKAKAFNKEEVIMGTTIDLGNLYRLQSKTKKAISCFREAGIIAEKRNDARRIFIINYNIAEIYIQDKKSPNLATIHLKKANEELEKLNNIVFNTSLELLYGYYYLELGNIQKALASFKESIANAKKANLTDELSNGYDGLLQAQELGGYYPEALQTFKMWDSLKQKQFVLDKEEYKQSIENKQQNIEIKQQLQNKEFENKLINTRNFTNKLILLASLFATFILGIFLLSLWQAGKKRKKLILDLELKNNEYLEAKKQSEKLSKAKTKFLSTVTHDLRTPLYGIIGLTNTLVDDPQLKNHQQDIKSLKFSADYLLALINDVLQINKLDSKEELKLDSQHFSIKDLMADIVESLQYMKAQNNNSINVFFENEIPSYIIGDRLKLSQILMNLIANALKFTKNGEVSVTITNLSTETQKDKESDEVFLGFQVKDNGMGIPLKKQKHIFEAFGQIENTGNFEGTGLGLSIVSKLLNQMGSKIKLESDGIKGSVFNFKLNFLVSNDFKQNESETLHSENLSILHGKKVLIVEDNVINQLVTKKILKKYKMTYDLANNGNEAVRLAAKNNYNIILMDINMPIMDGIEAVTKIRTFNEDVPIILLTAVELVEIDERIKQLKYQDVIIKPYVTNSFLRTIIKNITT